MRKKISLLIILLLAVLSIPVVTIAKGDNGFIADDEVKIEESKNTTSFVAGNNVEMSSEIDGMNFVAGNNISLSSRQDHLFVAGNSINLENISTKDAFVAGNVININTSKIRDLYVAGSSIRIDSDIERNAYIGAEKVTINSTIHGDVKIAADDIRIGKEAVIEGTLEYPEEAKISISDKAFVNKTKSYKGVEVNKKALITTTIADALLSCASLLLIGLLLMGFVPKLFKKLNKEEKSTNFALKTAATGFGVLVLVPFAAIFIMVTVIGIPLSIITLLLYGILVYLSMIPTAYYVGKALLKDTIKNDYLLLALSTIVIYFARFIPFLGGIIGFISLILGLGLFTNLMKQIKLK